MSRGRPTVLAIVNRPNWAHDRKTDALARELGDSIEIVKRFHADVIAEDLERADCVLLYFWLQLEQLPHLREAFVRHRERLLIGVCSQFELAADWREPGLRVLRELPRAVFVNNRQLERELSPLLPAPPFYTPNGVDTDFFTPPAAPRSDEATLRVGWAGSLTNHGTGHRGVEELIAPGVAAVPGAELCLAAREERWRDRDEMLAFYRTLDVYVCASRSEGTPNPCLEAAACGLPVVTTRVGNMPELIRDGENGLFVERDAADIASRIARLRDDPELRLRLGRAARDSVVRFWDWRIQAKRYLPLFETTIGRLAAPAGRRRD